MTNGTTTIEWVEAQNLAIGDMTDKGPITSLTVSWDCVLITAQRDGAALQTRWGQAPTHFVRVTR